MLCRVRDLCFGLDRVLYCLWACRGLGASFYHGFDLCHVARRLDYQG